MICNEKQFSFIIYNLRYQMNYREEEERKTTLLFTAILKS